jgi:hypothetical protein
MPFLFIFRRICSERVFSHHLSNSISIMSEFTVGKDANDYYDSKNDDKVFHSRTHLNFVRKKRNRKLAL